MGLGGWVGWPLAGRVGDGVQGGRPSGVDGAAGQAGHVSVGCVSGHAGPGPLISWCPHPRSPLPSRLRAAPPCPRPAARHWAAAPWTCLRWTTECCGCRSRRWSGPATSGWWPTKVRWRLGCARLQVAGSSAGKGLRWRGMRAVHCISQGWQRRPAVPHLADASNAPGAIPRTPRAAPQACPTARRG